MKKGIYYVPSSYVLESGEKLENVKVVFHTSGTLNEEKSNVILIIHALSANSEVYDWWSGLYGLGNLFDPKKYFILCANNLGSPYGTTSPKSVNPATGEEYALDFPFFTLKDTARLHILLLEHLGIQQIKLLIGPSCGGNIAQEIAISLGEKIKNLSLICCSAQETPWAVAIHEAGRQALRADPEFFDRNKRSRNGLIAARGIAIPFYRSHLSFKKDQYENDYSRIKEFKASSYIRYQGEKFARRFDASCYYHLLNALDSHNVSRERKSMVDALNNIKAKTICISFTTDILVPPDEQEFLSNNIPQSKLVKIETVFGHDSFLIDHDLLRKAHLIHLPL